MPSRDSAGSTKAPPGSSSAAGLRHVADSRGIPAIWRQQPDCPFINNRTSTTLLRSRTSSIRINEPCITHHPHLAYRPRLNNVPAAATPQLPTPQAQPPHIAHASPWYPQPRSAQQPQQHGCAHPSEDGKHEKQSASSGIPRRSHIRSGPGRAVWRAICNMSASCGAKLMLILRNDLWLMNSMSTSLRALFKVRYSIRCRSCRVHAFRALISAGTVVLEAPVIRGTTSFR